MWGAAVLILILGTDFFIYSKNTFVLDRIDGFLLLLIFAGFIWYIIHFANKDKAKVPKEVQEAYKTKHSLSSSIFKILGGLGALILGGQLFVYCAQNLVKLFGVSEGFIGLSIAAVGTSLPELATSAVAAYKKRIDIAVGNTIGSNIFNIAFDSWMQR